MTKEELFFKENYPEYVTEKGECLSPYWDLFSVGVICATFELNIELGKLEGKLADLTSEYYELENLKNNEIAELKKRNAELDCQKNRNKSCYSCANATERCFRNEIGCPCKKYKSYKEEIAELKAYNEKLLDGDIEKHNKIVELQNRNGELAGQVASLNRWFGEAKGIIKDFLSLGIFGIFKGTTAEEIICRAEQFLKECE